MSRLLTALRPVSLPRRPPIWVGARGLGNTARPSRIVFDEGGLPLALGITPQAVQVGLGLSRGTSPLSPVMTAAGKR